MVATKDKICAKNNNVGIKKKKIQIAIQLKNKSKLQKAYQKKNYHFDAARSNPLNCLKTKTK